MTTRENKRNSFINILTILFSLILAIAIVLMFLITLVKFRSGEDISGYIVTYLVAFAALLISDLLIPTFFRKQDRMTLVNIDRGLDSLNTTVQELSNGIKNLMNNIGSNSNVLGNLHFLLDKSLLQILIQLEEEKHIKTQISRKLDILFDKSG